MSVNAALTGVTGPASDRRNERRNAVLDAAENLFLEQGYERVTLSAIVKRSGGSLATVYEMFGNKQGLLRAVVDRSIEEDFSDWRSAAIDGARPSEQLVDLAVRIHNYMTDHRTVAFKRIVIGESLRDPAFALAFYEQVHIKRRAELVECFAEWMHAGKAAFDDFEAAADLYVCTVVGEAQHEAMLGIATANDQDRVIAGIKWRLAPFLSYFKVV